MIVFKGLLLFLINQNPTNMISYEKVAKVLTNPPSEDMVDLYNDLDTQISSHPFCVNEDNPIGHIMNIGKFCISATSIQSKYIAFVLGKHKNTEFPPEIIQLFFNVENYYKMQFGRIKGDKIDGCICLVHREIDNFDLQKVYDSIYDL